ncbi:MAG: phosphatase PAP2 family protein [Gilvibacter sp.]
MNYFPIRIFLVLQLLLCSQFSLAQTANDSLVAPSEQTTWEMLKYDAKSVFGGALYAVTAPARWNGEDFSTAAGIIVGTVGLHTIDHNARAFFLEQNGDVPDLLKDIGYYFGSPQNFFLITGGLYSVGLITKNEKVRNAAVLIISSSAVAGFYSALGKSVIGRQRPEDGASKFEFDFFSDQPKYHSFPSGHTILSMSMAHAIAKQFDNWWIKAGIYSVGSIAPVSRLWADAHWITDVAIGAAISIVVVDSIDNYLHKEKRYPDAMRPNKKIKWRLAATPRTIGVIGTF